MTGNINPTAREATQHFADHVGATVRDALAPDAPVCDVCGRERHEDETIFAPPVWFMGDGAVFQIGHTEETAACVRCAEMYYDLLEDGHTTGRASVRVRSAHGEEWDHNESSDDDSGGDDR